MNKSNSIDKFYLDAYEEMIGVKNKRAKKRNFHEEENPDDENLDDIMDDEEVDEIDDEEGDDAVDEADAALEQIDLDGMSPEAKVELIYSIIDSHQNSVESDEEFSEFMEKLEDIMGEFQTIEEPEEEMEEEPMEDEEEFEEEPEE